MSAPRGRTRVWFGGDCDGLAELRLALEGYSEFLVLGYPGPVRDTAPRIAAAEPDVVVHATRSTTVPDGELAAIREHSPAPIVLLTSTPSQRLIEEALAADVADVLVLPVPVQTAAFAIQKAASVAREAAAEEATGRLVTVFSPKGGTGKSVTATNLASAVAAYGKRRTLLVDLDLQFGDAAIMLGVQPQRTLHDLVSAPGDIDADKLGGYTTPHASGLDVLPAPLRPEDGELVTEARVEQLLDAARTVYDVVVIDTSPYFHGPMLTTLDRTDDLLLLAVPDVPTLKNVRLTLRTLELLSFPRERIRVVLNRSSAGVGLTASEVATVLDHRIDFELPTDQTVSVAVNRGQPAVLYDARSPFSRALLELHAQLLEGGRPERPRPARRLLAFLRG